VVEAAHRFDAGRGVKFGSYAAWWIRKAISSALGTASSVVTVPRYSFERRRHVIEAITSGRPIGRRDLSADEVAVGLGLSSRQVEQALAFSIGAVSLDAPIAADDTRSVGERLARPSEEGPEAIALNIDRARCTRAALAVLSPRQRLIVALRYGLGADGAEPASLTDVARVVGLSRERVRQIENQALQAIRDELATSGWKPLRG
jgi:RNA polymerase primary sigma factor